MGQQGKEQNLADPVTNDQGVGFQRADYSRRLPPLQ